MKISIKNIQNVAICSWAVLGFTRGINSYDYSYKPKLSYLYIDKCISGLGASLVYICPLTFFYVVYKEVYRLEINLRGLEDDKKTDFYNQIF